MSTRANYGPIQVRLSNKPKVFSIDFNLITEYLYSTHLQLNQQYSYEKSIQIFFQESCQFRNRTSTILLELSEVKAIEK